MGRSLARGATAALLALLALVMGGAATGASAAGPAVIATGAGGTTSSGNATEAGAPLGARGAAGTALTLNDLRVGDRADVTTDTGGGAARLAAASPVDAPAWVRWLLLLLLIALLGLLLWAISRRRPRDSFILERDPEARTVDPAEVTTERIVRPEPGGTAERSTDRNGGPPG